MRMPFPYNSSPYFFFPQCYLNNKLNIFFKLPRIPSFFLCQSPRIVWKWINLTNIIIWLMFFFLLLVFISISMCHRFLCSVSGRIGSDRRWFGYPAMRYEFAVIGRCHLPCCLVPRTQQEADLHVSNIFVRQQANTILGKSVTSRRHIRVYELYPFRFVCVLFITLMETDKQQTTQ